MADNSKVMDFLAEQRDAAPADVQHHFLAFEELYERQLWHQLTEALIEYFNLPESDPQRLVLYKTFVLKLVDLLSKLEDRKSVV